MSEVRKVILYNNANDEIISNADSKADNSNQDKQNTKKIFYDGNIQEIKNGKPMLEIQNQENRNIVTKKSLSFIYKIIIISAIVLASVVIAIIITVLVKYLKNKKKK